MIALNEHTSLLRKLVFHAGAKVERAFFAKPVVVVDTPQLTNVLSLDEQVGCNVCGEPYKPFHADKGLVIVLPACDGCVQSIWKFGADDELVPVVSEMLRAKSFAAMFDLLCARHPWLLQESFAYNQSFTSWCEHYDKLRKEFAAYKKAVEDESKKSWIKRWFGR